jgi:Xaa-Pro aminopeptidase
VDVAVPSRDFAFSGVPFRSSVLLWPAGDCLVHLTDLPFLVVTMEDVEIAHLERVQVFLTLTL